MARITLAMLQQQLTDHQSAYQAASEQRDRALERLAYAEHSDEGLKYIAALEASLDKGRKLYAALRAENEALKAQLAQRVVFIKPRTEPKPVVTRFYRGGKLWEKTRIGNDATERLVERFVVEAGKYDGNEENCKYSESFATREEAERALARVSDYPWSRIRELAVA